METNLVKKNVAYQEFLFEVRNCDAKRNWKIIPKQTLDFETAANEFCKKQPYELAFFKLNDKTEFYEEFAFVYKVKNRFDDGIDHIQIEIENTAKKKPKSKFLCETIKEFKELVKGKTINEFLLSVEPLLQL